MMDRQRYEDLERRRDIIQQLMGRTTKVLQTLVAEAEAMDTPDPIIIAKIQRLTFMGKVLVAVMGKLADEATQLRLELKTKNTDAAARRVAPTIDPTELIVPDYMPDLPL